MKTIGLLGGTSWESSIVYERIISEEVQQRLGGSHSADLLIRNCDFAVVESLQSAGAWSRWDGCSPRTLAYSVLDPFEPRQIRAPSNQRTVQSGEGRRVRTHLEVLP
jgi:hypothetical protein